MKLHKASKTRLARLKYSDSKHMYFYQISSKRHTQVRIVKNNDIDCDIRVEIYGSMATGLAIDSSDMDVLVQGVFKNETPDRS